MHAEFKIETMHELSQPVEVVSFRCLTQASLALARKQTKGYTSKVSFKRQIFWIFLLTRLIYWHCDALPLLWLDPSTALTCRKHGFSLLKPRWSPHNGSHKISFLLHHNKCARLWSVLSLCRITQWSDVRTAHRKLPIVYQPAVSIQHNCNLVLLIWSVVHRDYAVRAVHVSSVCWEDADWGWMMLGSEAGLLFGDDAWCCYSRGVHGCC